MVTPIPAWLAGRLGPALTAARGGTHRCACGCWPQSHRPDTDVPDHIAWCRRCGACCKPAAKETAAA